MDRPLESYDVPYPSKRNKDIQSIIYSKKEFRECQSGPKISEDKVVQLGFFNTQVFFQRYVAAFGSVCLFWKPGSGKSGAFILYQKYMNTFRPGEVSAFYFIAGETQINDFERQAAYDFGEVKRSFHGDVGKSYEPSEKTKVRRYIKSQNTYTLTYKAFATLIDSLSDDEDLINEFSSAVVFIDEVHSIKLTQEKDMSETEVRDRRIVYTSFWRVGKICPTCIFILSTGTPMTNIISELIYLVNLIPGGIQIKTPLSELIAKDANIDLGESIVIDFNSSKAEKDLEYVLRGTVLFCEAPSTGAVKSYLTKETINNLPILKGKGRFTLYTKPLVETSFESSLESSLESSTEDSTKLLTNNSTPWSPSWRSVVFDEKLGMYITKLYMSPFQTRGYKSVQKSGYKSVQKSGDGDEDIIYDAVYSQVLQASVFVFPTKGYAKIAVKNGLAAAEQLANNVGLVGSTEGFKSVSETAEIKVLKKFKSHINVDRLEYKIIDILRPYQWFKRYLYDDELLYNSGVKVYDIVMHAIDKKIGPIYVASKYHDSTSVVIGWALEARGFTEYTPDEKDIINLPTKRKRYAIIHGRNKKNHQKILEFIKHKENIRGKYLKVIMISPVGATGINIFNVEHGFILEPHFNMAEFNQASNRILRPNSHINSLAWIKNKFNMNSFPVYMHYCVGELYSPDNKEVLKEVPKEVPIDWQIYFHAVDKDKETSRVMRMLKRIAIDAQVNIKRNTPKTIEDYSSNADYQLTKYKPFNINTTWNIDLSTYDSYYTNKYNENATTDLSIFMSQLSFGPLEYVLETVQKKGYSSAEVLFALQNTIGTKAQIGKDFLGFPIYLKEDNNILYTTRDMYETKSISDRAAIFYTTTTTLQSDVSLDDVAIEFVVPEDIELKKEEIVENSDYVARISYFPSQYKSALFEEAITKSISGDISGDNDTWYTRIIDTLKHLYGTDDTSGDIAHFHRILTLFDTGTSYDAINAFINANTSLRVMYESDKSWRPANKAESDVYFKELNNKLQPKLEVYYEANKALGFIGIIVKFNTVHIRYFTKDNDGKFIIGRSSSNVYNIEKYNILPLLYKACPLAKRKNPKLSDSKKSKLLASIKTLIGKKNLDISQYQTLPKEQLIFYEKVLSESSSRSSHTLARKLSECLLKRNAIFAITGDPKAVVENMT